MKNCEYCKGFLTEKINNHDEKTFNKDTGFWETQHYLRYYNFCSNVNCSFQDVKFVRIYPIEK